MRAQDYLSLLIFIIAAFVSSCSTPAEITGNKTSEEPSELEKLLPKITPVKVAYLGSYHMSNPGADQFNLESDDVLLPKRQAEIKEVVNLLKAFNPTKIAVESPLNDSLTLARYQGYLDGTIELRRSEEEQIGFRLAKMLGHQTIYPIDVKQGLPQDEIGKLVGSDPQKYGPYLAELEKTGNGAMEIMDGWLKNGTIREMLYNMNDPELEYVALELYFRYFVPIVKDDNYAGADMVNTWYHRNIRIFSNLHQVSDSQEDRILVVYGQGHVPLLKHFTEQSPYFEVEDVRKYLGMQN